MRELEVKKVLESVEIGGRSAMLGLIETGGFAIISRLEGFAKVCFSHDLTQALTIYAKCRQEILGGPGQCWIN